MWLWELGGTVWTVERHWAISSSVRAKEEEEEEGSTAPVRGGVVDLGAVLPSPLVESFVSSLAGSFLP